MAILLDHNKSLILVYIYIYIYIVHAFVLDPLQTTKWHDVKQSNFACLLIGLRGRF